jgi:hypothetical protein
MEVEEVHHNAAMLELIAAAVPDEMDFHQDLPPPPMENSTISGLSSAAVENEVTSGLVSNAPDQSISLGAAL